MALPCLLEVEDIRNTQRTVQNRIDNGRGRQEDLLQWTSKLLRGSIRLEQLQIREAVHPSCGRYYSADNRRLFVLKAL